MGDETNKQFCERVKGYESEVAEKPWSHGSDGGSAHIVFDKNTKRVFATSYRMGGSLTFIINARTDLPEAIRRIEDLREKLRLKTLLMDSMLGTMKLLEAELAKWKAGRDK